MKTKLLFIFLLLSLTVKAQQWSSEADINNFYNRQISNLRQEIDEASRNREYALTLPEKDQEGRTNLQRANILLESAITIQVNQKKIEELEKLCAKKINDFRIQQQQIREQKAEQKRKHNKQKEGSLVQNSKNVNRQKELEEIERREAERKKRTEEEERRREEERRKKEEYGNMVRDEKFAELHAKNAGRREYLSQKSEEMAAMRENVNTSNHQREMLGDGDWIRLEAEKKENTNVNLNINPALRRQINLGRMKIRDSIAADIDTYLLSHIGDVRNVPLDEYFCYYVMQKVLSYYRVDKMKFLWKQCDPALESEIEKVIQDYSTRANQIMRNNIDKCNNGKMAPTWEMLRNSMREKNGDKGLDRFISTINILSTSNSGVLPTPLGSDKDYYYYRLGYSQKVARVSIKKLGMIDVVSCDYETRDLESLKSSMEGKSSMIPYTRLFDHGIGMKTYNVLADGSAKGKITDKSGNVLDYKVKPPHLEISREGNVVLRNTFDETYTSNHQYSNIDFSVELDFKICSIKWDTNGELTIKGKKEKAGEVEVSLKDGITKEGVKEKISPLNLSVKHDNEKKSTTYDGSFKLDGILVEKVVGQEVKDKIKGYMGNIKEGTVGVNYTHKENGYVIGGNIGAKNVVGSVGVKGSRSISSNDDGSQHLKNKSSLSLGVASDFVKVEMESSHEYEKAILSSEENKYVGKLPSNLLTEIYTQKYEDFVSNGIPMYADIIVDEYDIPHKLPLTRTELEKIRERLLENASKASNEDFKYQPSNFDLFRTCIEVDSK